MKGGGVAGKDRIKPVRVRSGKRGGRWFERKLLLTMDLEGVESLSLGWPFCDDGRAGGGWQDVGAVLGYFGRRKKRAIIAYENYVREGIEQGRRPELVGGGLIRSMGGWSEVLSLRRRGEKTVSDERILGSGEFIEQLLSEAEEKAKETLGWRGRIPDLGRLLSRISKKEHVEEQKVRGGDRRRSVVGARKVFPQVAVKRLGYTGASVARFLGVTTSLVNPYASSESVGNLDQYL